MPLLALLGLSSALAATWTVGSGGDFATLDAALAGVASGDTLVLDDGTWAGCFDTGGLDLRIEGTSEAGTVLDGTGCDSALSASGGETVQLYQLTLSDPGGHGVSLSGGSALEAEAVTITGSGGEGLEGGAIYASGASGITLVDSTLSGNVAELGGAIYIDTDAGAPTFDGSGLEVSGNSASSLGGAIYLGPDGGFTCSACSFGSNTGTDTHGAAIYAEDRASLSLDDTVFSGNAVDNVEDGWSGGAVYLGQDATLTATGATFSGNSAARGGAIYAPLGAVVSLTGATITDNVAYEHGGAFYGRRGLELSLDGSTLSGNVASYGSGGAFYLYGGGSLSLSDSTVTGSEAWEAGGAAYLEYGVEAQLSGVELSGCRSLYSYGGAWFQYFYGTLTLSEATFRANQSFDDGGAIRIDDLVGPLVVEASTFEDNLSAQGSGGALAVNRLVDVSVTDSVFSGNQALYDGGGLYLSHDGSDTLSGLEIIGNEALSGDGGGLYVAPQTEAAWTVALEGSSLTDNRASGHGGALFVREAASLSVLDTVISRNAADVDGYGFDGGGAYVDSTPNVEWVGGLVCANQGARGGGVYLGGSGAADDLWANIALIENTATGEGGAMAVSDSALTLQNDTLLGGGASSGGGVWLSGAGVAMVNGLLAWTTGGDGLVAEDEGSAAVSSFKFNDFWLNISQDRSGTLDFDLSADGNLSVDPGLVAYSQNGDCDDDDWSLAEIGRAHV